MAPHLTRRQRLRAMVPVGWAGYLAALAGAAAVAVTLIAWAGGHLLATVIAAALAVALFAAAAGAYALSRRNARDRGLQTRMSRLRHAKYRSAYPTDRGHPATHARVGRKGPR